MEGPDVYLADSYDKTIKQFIHEDYAPEKLENLINELLEITIAGTTTGFEFLTEGPAGIISKHAVFTSDKFLRRGRYQRWTILSKLAELDSLFIELYLL